MNSSTRLNLNSTFRFSLSCILFRVTEGRSDIFYARAALQKFACKRMAELSWTCKPPQGWHTATAAGRESESSNVNEFLDRPAVVAQRDP
jgi:hypothetical protein